MSDIKTHNFALNTAAAVLRASESFSVELPTLQHFIGGRHVPSLTDDTFEVMDPARGTRVATIPLGGHDDVDAAVQAARNALPRWANLTPKDRSDALLEIADALHEDKDRMRQLEALNCGKPLEVTADDVDSAIDTLRFMAGAGRTGTTIPAGDYVEGTTSLILREPVGVIGLVTPWNYPLLMVIWKLAPALMMGNTVVLKPSEVTPLTALRLAELAADILPPGVLNIVNGTGPNVGRALSSHAGIDMVALTGSVRAGKDVAEAASRSVTRTHLELGGKAPVLIFNDADIAHAAYTVAEAGFWNSGQECGAACRILVHESIAKEFGEGLVDLVKQYQLSDPEVVSEKAIGPIIYHDHYLRVSGMLGEAIDRGAQVLHGGMFDDSQGYWIEPTVLKVARGDTITKEEVFGPIVTIETFINDEEAIFRANDVDYGLTASVFSSDVTKAMSTAKALDFGSVNVNTHLALPTEMPWGGFKQSGYGRDLSSYALEDYSRTKHLALYHAS